MLTIALDAMGGDHAPKSEVEGAVLAARSYGVKVILVGQQDVVRRELDQVEGHRELPIEIVHASERVTMEDSAAKAVRGCFIAVAYPVPDTKSLPATIVSFLSIAAHAAIVCIRGYRRGV